MTLTRRDLLAGGRLLSGLFVGEVVSDSVESVGPNAGRGALAVGQLGDWPVVLTNDWDSVEIKEVGRTLSNVSLTNTEAG